MGCTVLMLGTSTATKGGISSVIRNYEAAGLFAKWPIVYLATHMDGTAGRKFLTAVAAWVALLRILLRREDIVLHVHTASRASFWRKSAFILPALWTGKQIVLHLHGGGFMRFYREECGALRKRVIRYVMDRSTRIIVLSRSWQRSVQTITRNPAIDVIANPALPTTSAAPRAEGMPDILLFLGRLESAKGIYILLEAFSRVAASHPAACLVCAGDGDLDRANGVITELGIEGRVELVGWVDENRRIDLLAAASIFVMPSFIEGLPMSLLEAMSAGLPVVATAVGGVPEVVTDGEEGFLVSTGDAEGLGEALCKLLDNPHLRQVMGDRARAKFDACFAANVIIPKLEALYRDLGVVPRMEA